MRMHQVDLLNRFERMPEGLEEERRQKLTQGPQKRRPDRLLSLT